MYLPSGCPFQTPVFFVCVSGLNTGGMGAYAPSPAVTSNIMQFVEKKVIKRAVDGNHSYIFCTFLALTFAPASIKSCMVSI